MSRILWGDYCFVVTDRRVAINTYADGCKKLGAGVIGCWSRLPFLFFQPPRVLFDDSLIVKRSFCAKIYSDAENSPVYFFWCTYWNSICVNYLNFLGFLWIIAFWYLFGTRSWKCFGYEYICTVQKSMVVPKNPRATFSFVPKPLR